ncbi:single-stranded DNA-binding protein [Marisediminicola senii]|uniref:single-stranded DNA-binding protein n=1 Tax=Marisediminicola senii TaxID=2711233 RepID=UPI0013EC2A53|nr:single-stranded DNA-binding protein [Marisediminicola senii]
MTDTLSITGVVGTTPKYITTAAGLVVTSFRLASTQRRYDRAQNKWVDGETNWYTVSAFRQLADNVASSVHRGQRVIVLGRLRIREWQGGDKSGINVDIEADSIGHDLTWGTATWSRPQSGSQGVGTATPASGADGADWAASPGAPAHSIADDDADADVDVDDYDYDDTDHAASRADDDREPVPF